MCLKKILLSHPGVVQWLFNWPSSSDIITSDWRMQISGKYNVIVKYLWTWSNELNSDSTAELTYAQWIVGYCHSNENFKTHFTCIWARNVDFGGFSHWTWRMWRQEVCFLKSHSANQIRQQACPDLRTVNWKKAWEMSAESCTLSSSTAANAVPTRVFFNDTFGD